jgi:hypothetical protein
MGDLGQLLAEIIDIGAQLWIVVDSELLHHLDVDLPAQLDLFLFVEEHQLPLTGHGIYSARRYPENQKYNQREYSEDFLEHNHKLAPLLDLAPIF